MKLIKTQVKEIFTKTKLPGADWVINQYVGCSHNCAYCYARFMARWKNYGQWGSWAEAKINAPDLVKNREIDGQVFMSSVSDCYQDAEKDLKLTRSILENLDKNTRLSILTKSDLILRDIDLLHQFKKLEVGMTINSFCGKEKEFFEPDSPTNQKRINCLKELKKNNIKTYCFVSPIIPKITDIKSVIEKTKKCADYFWFEIINLRGADKEFITILEKNYPESLETLRDKNKLEKYIENLKGLIEKENIKIRGIELH